MPETELQDYLVVSPLLADGKKYGIDSKIALSPDAGDPLVAQGVLKHPEKAEEAKSKKQAKTGDGAGS